MDKVLNYIKHHWLICLVGAAFFGWFLYLTYSGNQLCDCVKTEKYQDGTTRTTSNGRAFYRYYHK